jgi:hypothetical protein
MNNLKSVSNSDLLTHSQKLRTSEREIQTEFLKYLAEIDARKLYLEIGFSGLFAMLTGYYGFSESAAFRRLNSMKALRDLPEAEVALKEGSVNLSTLSQMQSFAKKAEVDKAELFHRIKNKSQKECERLFAEIKPEVNLAPDQTKALSPQHVELKVVVSPELLEKIEKIRNLRPGHSGSYEEILHYMADQVLKQIDPAREPERKVTSPAKVDPDRRHPTAAQKREVYQRDQTCTYVDPESGRRCGSQFAPQVDHEESYALGGPTEVENLRLLCAAHHQRETERLFGKRYPRK